MYKLKKLLLKKISTKQTFSNNIAEIVNKTLGEKKDNKRLTNKLKLVVAAKEMLAPIKVFILKHFIME